MEERNKNSLINNIIWIIIIVGGIFYFLVFKQDTWRGFYYPNGVISDPSIYSPEYKTKEDCISWAENERSSRPQDASIEPQNLYECGKNCKLRDPSDPKSLYVCDQTFDGGDWRAGSFGE